MKTRRERASSWKRTFVPRHKEWKYTNTAKIYEIWVRWADTTVLENVPMMKWNKLKELMDNQNEQGE